MEFRDKIAEDEMILLRKEWELAGLAVQEERNTILLVTISKESPDEAIFPAAYAWIDEQWRLLDPGLVAAVVKQQLMAGVSDKIRQFFNQHTSCSPLMAKPPIPITIPLKDKDNGVPENDTDP